MSTLGIIAELQTALGLRYRTTEDGLIPTGSGWRSTWRCSRMTASLGGAVTTRIRDGKFAVKSSFRKQRS